MAFNQAMSIPIELKLVTTPDGPRLTWTPVKELKALRGAVKHLNSVTLQPDDANLSVTGKGQSLEINMKLQPNKAKRIEMDVQGATIVYDARDQKVAVNGVNAKAPLQDGTVDLKIYLDRTSIEVFADNGLVYIPQALAPHEGDATFSVHAEGGSAVVDAMDIYSLESAWKSTSSP